MLEQKNRKRTRFQVAVFAVIAVNLLIITPMLIQGCSRQSATDTTQQQSSDTNTQATALPPTTNTDTTPVAPPPTNIVSTPVVPPVAPPPAPTATEYVIVKGDTLDSIHKKFSVSVKAIEDANPGIVPTKLQPGHKIQIPAATAPTAGSPTVAADGSEIYVVKPGDTLSKIATAHGTTYKAIEALNNLKSTKIKAGDKLKMPPPKAAAAPPPAAPAPAPATTPSPTPPPTTTP